jgi:hypothetical protein
MLHYNLIKKGTLHEDLCTFMIISRRSFLRMRNMVHKTCREDQNTHFIFNNFFFLENPAVYEILWKKCGSGGETADGSIIWRTVKHTHS